MTAKAMASGRLTKLGKDHWKSSGGLVYKGKDPQGRNRIEHVAGHLTVDNKKKVQSIFAVPPDKLLKILDEAWLKKVGPGKVQKNGNIRFDIPMGRRIGANGETSIRIIIKKGTANEIVTVFPI